MKIKVFPRSCLIAFVFAAICSAPLAAEAQSTAKNIKKPVEKKTSLNIKPDWLLDVPNSPVKLARATQEDYLFFNNTGCTYWNTLVDPQAPKVSAETIERDSKNILKGISCLLESEGRKELGVRYGQKPFVSQVVPNASVEINALYEISELFYGNDDFAHAIALTADPPKLVGEYDVEEFNSPEVVSKAFASYRKWFETVQKIGLDEARKQKLDPLINSGIRWY